MSQDSVKTAYARYVAHRAELAGQHDDGAHDALREAAIYNIECGGDINLPEVLADLAMAGWRLART